MYLKLSPILTFISFLTFISCQKDNNNIIDKIELIPLKTGNTWTYENYRSNILIDTSLIQIGDYININGNKGYKFISGDYPLHETFIADNDIEGDFVTIGGYSDTDSLFAPSIDYKRNAIKGDSWDYQEISFDQSGIFKMTLIKVYCTNTDTMIDTHKGLFNCKVYKWSPNLGEDNFFEYISENVGIVKMEHFENNKLFTNTILLDYKINK